MDTGFRKHPRVPGLVADYHTPPTWAYAKTTSFEDPGK